MNNSENALVYWGLALVAGAYSLLSLRLVRQESWQEPVNRIGLAMLAAALLTVVWSGFSLLALTVSADWWLGAQSADMLRYLCWGVFVALFFNTSAGAPQGPWYRWLPGLASAGLLGVPALIVLVNVLAGRPARCFSWCCWRLEAWCW